MTESLNIEFEENSHINKFIKNIKLNKDELLNTISLRYKEYATLNNQKIKVIPKIKHLKNSVFEFKVPLIDAKYKDIRVAYFIDNKTNTLFVFFISSNILKRDFVKELNATNLID